MANSTGEELNIVDDIHLVVTSEDGYYIVWYEKDNFYKPVEDDDKVFIRDWLEAWLDE